MKRREFIFFSLTAFRRNRIVKICDGVPRHNLPRKLSHCRREMYTQKSCVEGGLRRIFHIQNDQRLLCRARIRGLCCKRRNITVFSDFLWNFLKYPRLNNCKNHILAKWRHLPSSILGSSLSLTCSMLWSVSFQKGLPLAPCIKDLDDTFLHITSLAWQRRLRIHIYRAYFPKYIGFLC